MRAKALEALGCRRDKNLNLGCYAFRETHARTERDAFAGKRLLDLSGVIRLVER